MGSQHNGIRLSEDRFPFLSILFALGMVSLAVVLLINIAGELRSLYEGRKAASQMLLPVIAQVALFVAGIYLAALSVKLKRVFLLEGRLQIRGLRRAVEIPLENVSHVDWIQEPVRDLTPIAAIFFRTPCAFGTEVRFTPRSRETVELLHQELARSRTESK